MTASKLYLRTKKGVSLLIGIVLIAIITAVAMGISNVVISAIRNTGNVNNANMAYYAAEGALEQGLLQSALQGAGYDASPTVPYDNCPTGTTCPTATVKIQGTVPPNANIGTEFVIPSPGTGTAGTNCNPLTAVTGYFSYQYDGTEYSNELPVEHPCNWNKIKVGETVSIPLYTTQEYAAAPITKNPVQLGLTNLKIKVRTPCPDGAEMCPFSARPDLDSVHGDPNFACASEGASYCGDTIVSWQITGGNKNGTKTYTMVANDLVAMADSKMKDKTNTEIYESLINAARTSTVPAIGFSCDRYCVLYANISTSLRWGKDLTYGIKSPISSFLLNEGDYKLGGLYPRSVPNDLIEKPVLKLTVVHSLADHEYPYATIPYLEYQITTNSSLTSPPADATQTITAEGLSGTFKQVLEVKQAQESGLLEYVIQQ